MDENKIDLYHTAFIDFIVKNCISFGFSYLDWKISSTNLPFHPSTVIDGQKVFSPISLSYSVSKDNLFIREIIKRVELSRLNLHESKQNNTPKIQLDESMLKKIENMSGEFIYCYYNQTEWCNGEVLLADYDFPLSD